MNFSFKSYAVIKSSFLLLILLLTTAFFGKDSCYLEYDWGSFEQEKVTIDPKDKYTNAFAEVAAGTPFYLKMSGEIDLCPDEYVISPYQPVGSAVKPQKDGWQFTNIVVEAGEKISLNTIGEYKDIASSFKNGKGLYALIIADPVNYVPGDGTHLEAIPSETACDQDITGDSYDQLHPNCKKWWPSADGHERHAKAEGSHPYFFELNNNGSLENSNNSSLQGFVGEAPASGRIWLRYARNAQVRKVTKEGSPWLGNYYWSHTCGHCIRLANGCIAATAATLILGSAAFVAPAGPPKIVAYNLAAISLVATVATCVEGRKQCISPGYVDGKYFSMFTDVVINSETGDIGKKCREKGGDHFVDGANNGEEGGLYNSGGYTIVFKKSCKYRSGEKSYLMFNNAPNLIDEDVPLYFYRHSQQRCYPDDNALSYCPEDPNTGLPCPNLECFIDGRCQINTDPGACNLLIDSNGLPVMTTQQTVDPLNEGILFNLDPSDIFVSSGIAGQVGTSQFMHNQSVNPNTLNGFASARSSGQMWFKIDDQEIKPSYSISKHPLNGHRGNPFAEGNRCEQPDGCMVDPGLSGSAVCDTADTDNNDIPDGYQHCIAPKECVYPINCRDTSNELDKKSSLYDIQVSGSSASYTVNNSKDVAATTTEVEIDGFSGANLEGPAYRSKFCFDTKIPVEKGSKIYLQTENWNEYYMVYPDGHGGKLDINLADPADVPDSIIPYNSVFNLYEMDNDGILVGAANGQPLAVLKKGFLNNEETYVSSSDNFTFVDVGGIGDLPYDIIGGRLREDSSLNKYNIELNNFTSGGANANLSIAEIIRDTEFSMLCIVRQLEEEFYNSDKDTLIVYDDTTSPLVGNVFKAPEGSTGQTYPSVNIPVFTPKEHPRDVGFLDFSGNPDNSLKISSVSIYARKTACSNSNDSFCTDKYAVPWGVSYKDNEGKYIAELIYSKSNDKALTRLLNLLVEEIREKFIGICDPVTSVCSGGYAHDLYSAFLYSGDNIFLNGLRAILALYIIVYGFMFMLGMIQDLRQDAMIRVIKIVIVMQLFHPSSWEFFSMTLFNIFIGTTEELIAVFAADFMGSNVTGDVDIVSGGQITVLDSSGNPTTVSANGGYTVERDYATSPFAFINTTLDMLSSFQFWVKMIALIFMHKGVGFIFFVVIIFFGLYKYFLTILKALVIYLLSIIAISLLLVISPIFISFLLFEQTKDLFVSWAKNMANYALQPVFVLTTLAVLNVFFVSALIDLMNFRVCTNGCLIKFPIGPCIIGHNWPTVQNMKYNMSFPAGVYALLIFIVITSAMYQMTDYMAKICAELTSGTSSTSLAKTAEGIVSGFDALRKNLMLHNKAYKKLTKAAEKSPQARARRAAGSLFE